MKTIRLMKKMDYTTVKPVVQRNTLICAHRFACILKHQLNKVFAKAEVSNSVKAKLDYYGVKIEFNHLENN